jgi:hypothetical protein
MDGTAQSIVEHNEIRGSVLGGGAIYPSSVSTTYFGHNRAMNHWSGDRESMTYDGNGGPAYYGPVSASAKGSRNVTIPAGKAGGYAPNLIVLNGTGFGQTHAVESYDSATRTYLLAQPLAAALGPDSYIQVLAYQARNIFAANQFTDNGAFQFFGSGVEQVISGNIGRRMGGFMAVSQALTIHTKWYYRYSSSIRLRR